MEYRDYLILGGSSGIGLSVAKKLTSKGNRVVIVGSNKEKLIAAIKMLDGTSNEYIVYNFNNVVEIENIFKYCAKKGFKLSGMVYCAGIAPLCLLKDNDFNLMKQVYNINLFSFIECCKYFYNECYSLDSSKIVVIASNAAHTSGYRQTVYGSSKAAIVASVRLMAKELYNRKITINCISPGATETEMLNSLRKNSENFDSKILNMQPLGIINPEWHSVIIEMLLGNVADFMTGNEIICDGGSLLK